MPTGILIYVSQGVICRPIPHINCKEQTIQLMKFCIFSSFVTYMMIMIIVVSMLPSPPTIMIIMMARIMSYHGEF